MYLINEEILTSLSAKFICKIEKGMISKIDAVSGYIKHLHLLFVLLDILKEHSRLTYAPWTNNA